MDDRRPIRNLTMQTIRICDDLEDLDLPDSRVRPRTADPVPRLDAWGLEWQLLVRVGPLWPHEHNGMSFIGRKICICIHSDFRKEDFMKALEDLVDQRRRPRRSEQQPEADA